MIHSIMATSEDVWYSIIVFVIRTIFMEGV